MPSTTSSGTRTTPLSHCCAAWSPPGSSAGSRGRASTTTAAERVEELGLPPCRWDLPDPATADAVGLVGVGADLEPATLVTAYCRGVFPMPLRRRRIGWWSPDPRGVLPVEGLVVSRSLRRSLRRYEVTVDAAFGEVIGRCATLPRRHGWISPEIVEAYVRLHHLGLAHSVEAWAGERLVGGLYGVAIGGLFAGESMFHTERDASKVALVRLVERLRGNPGALLDVQWTTPHLASLGAVDVPRAEYLRRLAEALEAPGPPLSDVPASPPR